MMLIAGDSRLEERFSIVGKDSIADALHSRLEELKTSNFKASKLNASQNFPVPYCGVEVANSEADLCALVEFRNTIFNSQPGLEAYRICSAE